MNNFAKEILIMARSLLAASTFGDRMSDAEGLVVLPQEPIEPSSLAIASEIAKVAKELFAVDFPNQKELDKYLHDHPAADRANHRVVKTPKKTKTPEKKSTPALPHGPPEVAYDKSGGRMREHRKHPGSGWTNFRDYNKSAKDYRNIEIMRDLPKGKLGSWAQGLKETLIQKGQKDVSDEMLYAIQVHRNVDNYTGTGFRDVNTPLRKGRNVNELGQETQSMIGDLDNFIAYTPKYGKEGEPPPTLYRGIHVDNGMLGKLKVGSVISEPAFVSASSSYHEAKEFLKGSNEKKRVLMQIEGARGVSLTDYSQQNEDGQDEQEVLLPRNMKFKITKMYHQSVDTGFSTTGKMDYLRIHVKPV